VASDSADNAKRRLLESGIESVRALKGFIVEHDRMKEERDQLKRQITGSEVETLRRPAVGSPTGPVLKHFIDTHN
jgi:hypothetical protein